MKPLELINYLFAILGAIGNFVGGAIMFINYFQGRKDKQMGKNYTRSKWLLVAGTVLIILFVVVISGLLIAKEKYKNEQLTTEAWSAYNDGKYELAIEKAKECIIEFQQEAIRQEKELKDKKADEPPIGKTTSEKTKEILRRGLLNDVATSWVIIGMSENKLNHREKAISAFKKAKQFTYARTYDPNGNSFWSPAEKADNYIKSIQQQLY